MNLRITYDLFLVCKCGGIRVAEQNCAVKVCSMSKYVAITHHSILCFILK